jgi:hypothetical protein
MDLPLAAGSEVAQAHAARAAAIAPQQVGRDPAFIEKDILARIAERLPGVPVAARGRNVRPTLFVGVYRFF